MLRFNMNSMTIPASDIDLRNWICNFSQPTANPITLTHVAQAKQLHPCYLQPSPPSSLSLSLSHDLQMSNDFNLFLRACAAALAEIPLHRQRRPRTLFDRAVDETAPANRPVGVGEENVALAGAEVGEGFGDEVGGGEEPVWVGVGVSLMRCGGWMDGWEEGMVIFCWFGFGFGFG